jgi:hypothetical protein
MDIAGIRGQGVRAAQLGGAIERLGMLYGLSRGEEDKNPYLANARSRVDEEVWRSWWEAGAAMTHDEAVAYALGEVG